MIHVRTKNGEALINEQNVDVVHKEGAVVTIEKDGKYYTIDDVTVYLPPNTPFRELEETKRILRRESIDRNFYKSATVQMGYCLDDIKYELNDELNTSIDVLRKKLKAHLERLEEGSQKQIKRYENQLKELQKEEEIADAHETYQ